MNKNIRLILTDCLYGLLILILYSPGLLGLYPNDPNILKAGISIIAGVLIFAGIIKTNIIDLRPPKLISTNKNVSVSECMSMLRMLNSRLFKHQISDVTDQLERADKYMRSFDDILTVKFSKGSMSYDKYASVIDTAIQSVIRNATLLASRIQMFDEEGYYKIRSLIDTGEYRRDDIDDKLQEQKDELYQANYKSIIDMVNLNEKILLQLDHLSSEISSMDSNALEQDNNVILEEITTLIHDTQYYN